MKILLLQDRFPPESWGGDGAVAFNLACSMQKLGHQVFVVTTTRKKEQAGQFKEFGLKIFRIQTDYDERWRSYLSLYNLQTISQVKQIFKQIQPDVTHIHIVHHYLSYYCLKIAKKYSRAVFLTAHDVMLFHYGKLEEFVDKNNLSIPKKFNYKITPWQQIKRFKKRYNPLRNLIVKHYLKYVDRIFAVSQALKDALEQNGITNVQVIHNGIDLNQWRVSQLALDDFQNKYNLVNRKPVFFIGRLSGLKGGEKIIQAMSLVNREIPEAVLLVAGKKDSYASQMSRIAEKEKVPLILTGWIEEQERTSAYFSSKVVVTPSIYLDPFNLINLEAMACRKPVVGTCFGGIPEIVIDNQTGYIVNPLDIKTMAEKILDLLENPERAKKFGLAGYLRAKQEFSLEKQVKECLKWYKKYV
jgi:alpha-maltose-1-phosphate synthase